MSKKNLHKVLVKKKNADYFYSSWLMHLGLLQEAGMTTFPDHVAEIGPGTGIGVGLCALLCGSSQYTALDLVRHAEVTEAEHLLFELADMLRNRAPRPAKVWPDYDQCLDDDLFPSMILTEERLTASLAPQRVQRIRNALLSDAQHSELAINYLVPWAQNWDGHLHSVDMLVSQSVMEHIDDLPTAYLVFKYLLKPGAWMSHYIDFKSHGITEQWNGHWAIAQEQWQQLQENYPYLINRQPVSRHIQLIKMLGFGLVRPMTMRKNNGLECSELCENWRNLDEEDRTTAAAYIRAKRK